MFTRKPPIRQDLGDNAADDDRTVSSDSSDLVFGGRDNLSEASNLSVISISQFSMQSKPKLPKKSAFMSNAKLIEQIEKKPEAKRVALAQMWKSGKPEQEISKTDFYGRFSGQQIIQTFNFMRGGYQMIVDDAQSVTDEGDTLQLLSIEDFWSSFRRVRRARNQRALEEEARRFMRTFRFMLQVAQKTPEIWFVETDTTPDCRLTWSEFEAGMNKLCSDLGGAMFSKSGLVAMLRYMDPSCVGELTAPDVKAAFKRIKLPSVSSMILEKSGPVFMLMQDFVMYKMITVDILFRIFDTDHVNFIGLRQFAEGIKHISNLLPLLPDIKSDTLFRDGMSPNFASLDGNKLNFSSVPPTPNRNQSRPTQIHTNKQDNQIKSDFSKVGESTVGAHNQKQNDRKLRKKLINKMPVPASPIQSAVIDTNKLKERKALLVSLPVKLNAIPDPVIINRKKIMKEGAKKHQFWLEAFDKGLRRNITILSEL